MAFADEMSRQGPVSTSTLIRRGACFFALWVTLIGISPMDLAVGVLAAAVATWASGYLWPSGGGLSGIELPRYAARFLIQSIAAGVDVAKYAFSPTIDMKPGFALYRTGLPPGMARDALCTVMSLQPGMLPVETAPDGTVRIHCLDVRQATASELASDEAAFLQILGRESHHG